MAESKPLRTKTKQAKSIPQFQPYFDHTEEDEVRKVLGSGWLIEHNATREFERSWATRTGSKYAIATTSGSVALWLPLKAAGVGPGDEVIVPDLTFAADANAVLMCGATPVFADVDTRGTISPPSVKAKITRKTKAIIIVHLDGRAAHPSLFDLKKDYFVIEDCAQSMETYYDSRMENHPGNSSHVGNYGHVGCYSLATSKHVTSGQGGVITTNDYDLYERIFRLKDHGRFERVTLKPVEDYFDHPGFNFKFTDLAAAIGLAQMRKWEFRMRRIWEIYRLYQEQLPRDLFIDRTDKETPWYVDIYPTNPEGVKTALAAEGIETRRMYRPLHTQPLYRDDLKHGSQNSRFSSSEWFYAHGLFLPSTTNLSDDEVIRVSQEIRCNSGS